MILPNTMTPYSWLPFQGPQGLKNFISEENTITAKIVENEKQGSLVFLLANLFSNNYENDSIVSKLPKELVVQILNSKTSLEKISADLRSDLFKKEYQSLVNNDKLIICGEIAAESRKGCY